MSGYLSLRAITYRTHSLNLIHLELPPSFTACLIDFRFPLNVFPILFLLTRQLFMFCSAAFLSFFPFLFFSLAFLLSRLFSFCINVFTPFPGSLVVLWSPSDFLLPSFLSCSFSNSNLGALQPGCLAQYEACVISSGALLEQIPQGLNRPCYLLSPLLCAMCT